MTESTTLDAAGDVEQPIPASTEPSKPRFDRSIVEGPLSRAVWKIAWPTMLTNAIGGLQGMVDHILVGNLVGYEANAAIGVSWQIILVVIVLRADFYAHCAPFGALRQAVHFAQQSADVGGDTAREQAPEHHPGGGANHPGYKPFGQEQRANRDLLTHHPSRTMFIVAAFYKRGPHQLLLLVSRFHQ